MSTTTILYGLKYVISVFPKRIFKPLDSQDTFQISIWLQLLFNRHWQKQVIRKKLPPWLTSYIFADDRYGYNEYELITHQSVVLHVIEIWHYL
jgi:hypothetical protein